MKKILFLILSIPVISFSQKETSETMNNEPIAKKQKKELTVNGHTRIDNYYWMNERDSKPVLDHLSLENQYTEKYFSSFDGAK